MNKKKTGNFRKVVCIVFALVLGMSSTSFVHSGAAPVVASGQFAGGPNGELGAIWRLYENGKMVIGAGHVRGALTSAGIPWSSYGDAIRTIVIDGNVTAGANMRNFFADLPSLSEIQGLERMNTGNATNMANMFLNASSLTSLDLSGWDARNVLQLNSMLAGTTYLSVLKLGENFPVLTLLNPYLQRYENVGILNAPNNEYFTGFWQNVGIGTVTNPQGAHVFTAAQLMTEFDGRTMADVWVWQPRFPRDEQPGEEQPEVERPSDEKPEPDEPEVTPPKTLRELFISDHIWYVRGFPDGSFRPEQPITRAEISASLWRLLNSEAKYAVRSNNFSDVSTGWYARAVSYLAYRNVVTGFPDGTFRPNAPVTRAELTAIMSRFFELDETVVNEFIDVGNTHWALVYINNAYAHGWVQGFEDRTFRPSNATSRAEAVTLINRVLGRTPFHETIDYHRRNYVYSRLGTNRLFNDITNDHWAFYHVMEAAMEHEYELDEHGREIWTEVSIPWLDFDPLR